MRALIPVLLLLTLACPAPAGAQAVPPGASTGAAEAITQATARLTGSVDPNGTETTYRFEYGTTTAYGLQTAERPAGKGGDATAAEASIEGLTPSTTYHYRLIATNPAGVARGTDRTFRTAAAAANPAPPSVATGTARGVGTRTATLAARVDPNRAATRVRFEYGPTTSYGARSREVDAGAGDSAGDVTIPVSGLRPRTTYHFRVVATNAAGVTSGRDRTLQTLAAPRAVTLALDADRVALGGTVTVTGRVGGTGVGRLPVALVAQPFPFGATPFLQLGKTVRTSSTGTFRIGTGPLLVSTRLRVVTRSEVTVSSATATALVRLRVGAGTRRAGSSRRRGLVTGTVTPATPGARVSVQRQASTGRFVPVGRTSTQPLDPNRSRYRLTVPRPRRTSTYRVSVLPPESGPHVRGTSRTFRIQGTR